jgi:hypothetical protein
MDENDGGGPHDANSAELFSWQPSSARGRAIMDENDGGVPHDANSSELFS